MVTIDQAISGASNVLIAVLAAHVLGVESFGIFGVVFLLYVMAQGVFRALICEPLLVHPVEAEERPGDAIGSGWVLGVALGVVILVAALLAYIWSAEAGQALLVLAPFVPLLAMQDLGRYLAIATLRPERALVLDLVWLGVMVLLVAGITVLDAETLSWLMVAWAGSGALAALLVLHQHRGHAMRPSVRWLRETWSFSWRYLVSYTSVQGSMLVASIALGAIAGARGLGAVNGALLMTRPFMMFQAAAISAGVAEVSRANGDAGPVRQRAQRLTMFTTSVALVNVAVIVLLPDSLGRLVLGDTWSAAEGLMLPAGLHILFIGATSGVRSGLLGTRAIRKTVRIEVVGTLLLLTFTVAGTVVSGAPGSLWGGAIAQGAVTTIWWVVFVVHLGQLRAGHRADTGTELPRPTPDQTTA
jgi:O-antigen/teichoic acid export membrane protein